MGVLRSRPMSENHGVRLRLWELGVAVALLGAAWLLPALAPVVLPALPPAPARFTAARDGRLLARHRYGNVPVRVVALPAATKDQRVYPIERIRGDAPPPGGYAGVAEDLATAPGKRRVAW